MSSKASFQDRLAAARKNRTSEFQLADCTLELRKWNYDQVLKHTGTLAELAKFLLNNSEPEQLLALLNQDIRALLKQYGDQLKEIAIDTLTASFENRGEAEQFFAELGIDAQVELFLKIWNDNMLPLASRLGLTGRLKQIANRAVEPRLSISLPTSSQPDTLKSESSSSTQEKNSSSSGLESSPAKEGSPSA